jgi:hypothetical protein
MLNFIHCFQSEWLKKKHTLASWLVIAGGFFIPIIMFIVNLVYRDRYLKASASPRFWEWSWNQSWNSMAMFLLPLGVVLVGSLITQLEYKNNTWKQLHTTPQRLTTIFIAKLAIILVMMVQFFILFNVGIYLSAVVPGFIIKAASYPAEPIAYFVFLKQNIKYFVDCLPIIALQFLLGLQFKNFLVSIAGGIALWLAAIVVLINSWKYSYVVPYVYTSLNFFRGIGKFDDNAHIHYWAVAYFILFMVAGYVLYITKKEKG